MLGRDVSLCLEVSHHREMVVDVLGLGMVSLLNVPSLVDNMSMGGDDRRFRCQRSYVWVFHLGEMGWILLTPLLSKWHNTSLICFVLTQCRVICSLSLLFFIL
jgi:hypothetical protein